MSKVPDDEIDDQVEVLKKEILPQLTSVEAHTFDIRPSVCHPDIEIFLGDGLYSVDSAHFRKVLAAKQVPNYVSQLLPRLRGKDSLINPQYTLQQVQKEVNAVLINLISEMLTEDELAKLDKIIETGLSQVMVMKPKQTEYSAGQYRFINGQYIADILRRVRSKNKNG